MSVQPRKISNIVRGMPASDGAGVRLTRIIGSPQLDMLDPFLLLDSFQSDQPQDYLAGFPDHPHRGFETVTYLLAGRMRHRDSAGHEGVIEPGGVQWMTAGRGIIHSEMPEQQDGLLHGFQLWVNLPAADKMQAPGYQEYDASVIPEQALPDGGSVRVIAGTTDVGTTGPVLRDSLAPIYMDVTLPSDGLFVQGVPAGHAAFVYVIDGELLLADQRVTEGVLGTLSDGEVLDVKSGTEGARFLLVAGRPIREPVARYGPFVMNTQQEIRKAFQDFHSGRF